MAAATSGISTSSNNRIPLNVIHGNQNGNHYNNYSSSSNINNTDGAYNMNNMGDESDRMKTRMKEFEDRCKRWREDFFVKHQGESSPLFTDINNNGNPKVVHTTTYNGMPNSSGAPSAPFTSTLHKSYIEDTDNGGKKYKIEFDIGDFKQNELQISTNGKSLVVKGDREVKAGSSTETKTFNRELTVPDYVDLDKMNAFLLDKNMNHPEKSFLILEAPIVMEKYAYRRSAFDPKTNSGSQTQSPTRLTKHANFANSPVHTNVYQQHPSSRVYGPGGSHTESHQTESKNTSTSQNSHHTTSRSNLVNGHDDNHYTSINNINNSRPAPFQHQPESEFYQKSPVKSNHSTMGRSNNNNNASYQSVTPELISGYPVYDNKEGCVIYKFDFSGFDQSEIHLTITVDRTLEIKACKESQDHLGKVYREFKREIQLESEVDANLIKNLLYEGILTLKIPKPNNLDGKGSQSNNHNLHSPNGFQEFYTDDGKLAKLTSDFKGFSPENVKIVLSANNVLKLNAVQQDSSVTSPNSKGTVKKECNRQYTLPAWIQPEQMRAIMSRDGILTVDFTGKSVNSTPAYDDRIHIN